MKVKKPEKKGNQRRPIFILFIGLLVGLCTASPVLQAIPETTEPQGLYPIRVHQGPKIDGILEEDTWKTTPLEVDFFSYSPIFGEKLPEKTLVWTAYDSNNLYFGFRCHYTESTQIKSSLTSRDNIFDDDWVGLLLDSLDNKQTAYGFYINPHGVQGDFIESAINGENISPDFVWESAGRIIPEGYQVEIAIPLKTLRFKGKKQVKMGILFRRKITRLGVSGAWPEPNVGKGVLNTMATVIYKELGKQLNLEILPAVTHSRLRERTSSQEWGKNDRFTDFGIGLKYGITSSITAELTINPDFSQVESDSFQVEVNQRYPLFYSEKRPFFMEGVDIFNFFTIEEGFLLNPVHTRRIVDPNWGLKVTGSAGKTSFGLLAAEDSGPGNKTFFSIARGKYSLGKDNYIGFLYSGHELTGDHNRVLGADLGYRLFKYQRLMASFLLSTNPAQKNKVDATHSTNWNFMYSYFTRTMGINTAVNHIGRDFRMDSSFLTRTGINNGWIWSGYYFYPNAKKLSWLKVINTEFVFQYLHDLNTHMDDVFFLGGLNFNFTRQGYLGIQYHSIKECWQGQTFDMSRFQLAGGIQLTKWLQIGGEINWGNKIHYEADPSYTGKGYDGSLSLVLQPTGNLNQQFNLIHSDLSKDKKKIYDLEVFYSRTTYQFNKYFFLRAILQYDSYQKRLLTDFLASFTLIPGTVLHIGYGGLYENREWQDDQWLYRQGDLLNIKRSFFLKASYLWRF